MTFEARVAGLTALGLSPRHAQFVATVALHSGYCLRRQYERFAGLHSGKSVRDFLDGLVTRKWATRTAPRPDRGYVYHLYSRPLYRALGAEHSRNRRPTDPAQITRKLMLLDYVLSRPDVRWYATEEDKVQLFTDTFAVPTIALPRRLYTSAEGAATTGRYFIDRLPIGISRDVAVEFVFLSIDGAPASFASFLRALRRLFEALPTWRVIVIGPCRWAGLDRTFQRFVGETAPADIDVAGLRWYFERRSLVERGALAQLTVDDIRRYREWQARLSTPALDALYRRWSADADVDLSSACRGSSPLGRGEIQIEALPFRYEQFGSLPGVA